MRSWDKTFKVLASRRPRDLLRLLPDVDPKCRMRLFDMELAAAPIHPQAMGICAERHGDRRRWTTFQLLEGQRGQR